MPQFSIIIPCYNRADLISESIECVRAQTVSDWELIVIDDGSTDRSAEVVGRYCAADARIKLVQQENAGLPAARNRGVSNASAPYVAFLDSDDLWHPAFLETVGLRLAAHPEFNGCACEYQLFDGTLENNRHIRIKGSEETISVNDILRYTPWAPHCAVIRRDHALAIGGFDESLKSVEDWDFWLRSLAQKPYLVIREPLAYYRVHGQQMSGNLVRMVTHVRRVADKFRLTYPEVVHQFGSSNFSIAVNEHVLAYARQAFEERLYDYCRVISWTILCHPSYPRWMFREALTMFTISTFQSIRNRKLTCHPAASN